MDSRIYVNFVQLHCEFQELGNHEVLSGKIWNLDPYSVHKSKNQSSHLIVEKSSDFNVIADISQQSLLYRKSEGFFTRQVHQDDDGGTIWSFVRIVSNEIYLQFAVTPAWDKITLLVDNTNTNGQLAFEYIGLIFPCVALNHNILTFHGALVEYNGYGVIISAASGVGKTTRARLWRDHKNALIINGDRATCQKVDGVWTGYGLPWSGTSGEQINRSVPLKALVVLERGEENTVRRMSPQESFGAVLPHLQCPTWDAELVGKAMEQMDDFLQNVPVLHFKSRPDVDAIEALCKALEEI